VGNARRADRTELSFQLGQEVIERGLFRGQQLGQSQAGKDTVALRDVSRETDAAALLEAHQHVALLLIIKGINGALEGDPVL
tara:strand:- start:45 stop:290 length:246 start_codon:yes stop_codon:yes gene_type:complete